MEATGMRHIRIGKDISLRWAITTDGAAVPLEGRDLTLEMKSPIGKVIILPYRLDGNVLTITYYGYEQTVVGEYSLTLWENKGKPGQNVVDAIRAFKLVRTSPEEADFIGGDLQVESVDLGTANLEILSGGGAATPGGSPDLSALEGKVAVNTASISNINEELDNVKEVQDGHNNSIANINTTLEEHSERIAQLESSTPGDSTAIAQIQSTLNEHAKGIANNKTATEENAAEIERVSNVVDTHESRLNNKDSEIEQINTKLDSHTDSLAKVNTTLEEHTNSINATSEIVSRHEKELSQIKTEQTEQNNRIADHEERLVYTEGDLVKVREEYNSIISELVKSIAHTQKAFVVETNDKEGYINIDGVKKTIPANSIKAFRFNSTFGTGLNGSKGISSFRFLVTDTSEITNMNFMFSAPSLTSLDLSSFDTSAATKMELMFYACSSLTSLDLSSFDTSAVTSLSEMFRECRSLPSLDLSSFDTTAATKMNGMFSVCHSLTSLDLSSFDTTAATKMNGMFYACSSLTSLLLGPNFFKTSAVTSIDFSSCSKWTNETVITSLVTNSYDRAAAGLNALTIKLHANTKAALSDEQKATITSKGYTIA